MHRHALSLWLNSVRGGLERLIADGPGFSSQGWQGNLGQDHVRICFEINFLDSKEGSKVASISVTVGVIWIIGIQTASWHGLC